MKIILWAVLIIFLIGLLVVTGVFKMLSLIHISEPTRRTSPNLVCRLLLEKKKKNTKKHKPTHNQA